MAFVYQVSFDISPDRLDELAVGASLERVVGYLRTLLPAHAGFIASRAMNSVDSSDRVEVVLQSVWETWDDLLAHRDSRLAEAKVLSEFANSISPEALVVHVYEEVD